MRLSAAAILRARQEGRASSDLRSVRSVMSKTGYTFEESCNLLDIPEGERKSLLDFLNNQDLQKEQEEHE